jgi:acetyl esterase/lipase
MKTRLRRIAARGNVDAAQVHRSRSRLERLARLGGSRTRGVSIVQETLGGVAAEIITPPDARAGVTLLYVHGGAFAMGSPRTHRSLTRSLALAARVRAVVPDYRLAPEHPYPAALDDVVAVYRALHAADASRRIVVGGESAGGNLALALVHALRARGEPLPAGIVAISPWADLACTGDSLVAHAELDTMVPVEAMSLAIRMYVGDAEVCAPTVSPLYGDFRGFPPLVVHVSSTEVLYDDARRVVETARAAGVDAELRVWTELPHAFPAFVDILPEARAAVTEIARFIGRVAP